MQLIEPAVKRQTPRPPDHIGPQAHSSCSLKGGMERAASDAGHERVKVEVGLDEGDRLTRKYGPMALLEHQMKVELLAFCAPARSRAGRHLGSNRCPELMKLGPVCAPMRNPKHAGGSLSSGDENADAVADFDHPQIRQRA